MQARHRRRPSVLGMLFYRFSSESVTAQLRTGPSARPVMPTSIGRLVAAPGRDQRPDLPGSVVTTSSAPPGWGAWGLEHLGVVAPCPGELGWCVAAARRGWLRGEAS